MQVFPSDVHLANRRLGGESNQETNFGFGSRAFVRTRALDVESEQAQNFRLSVSLFPFCLGDLSLLRLGSM